MGWLNKSHGRMDRTREGTRQLGLCGMVQGGVCGYERGAKSVWRSWRDYLV